MKKVTMLVWVCSLFILPATVQAQGDARPAKERIEAMKIAFITDRLQLTPEEAKGFWPVYNKMETEMKELRRKYRLSEEEELPADLSEQEAEKRIGEMISFREAQVALIKKYQIEFKKVISSKKILLLYRAEEDFKRELIRKIRERRMGPPAGGPPPGR